MIHELKPHKVTRHYIAYSADGTKHVGTTLPYLQTTSGQEDFISAESEQEIMKEANIAGLDFTGHRPLPEEGEWVEGGIWSSGAELVICRQAHTRTFHDPSDIPALFSTHRDEIGTLDWIENEQATVGMIRIFNGVEYTCSQAHQTQSDWSPPATPPLWVASPSLTGEWVDGEPVAMGDIRSYSGTDYRCLQDHTTQSGWIPPNVPALWEVV
jgi:hypothetical protein